MCICVQNLAQHDPGPNLLSSASNANVLQINSVPAPFVPDPQEDMSLVQPKLEYVGFLALSVIEHVSSTWSVWLDL